MITMVSSAALCESPSATVRKLTPPSITAPA